MDDREDEVKEAQVVEARARNISHNVRCTECGSQSIEDSQADIAVLLRKVLLSPTTDLVKQISTTLFAVLFIIDIRNYRPTKMSKYDGNKVVYGIKWNAYRRILRDFPVGFRVPLLPRDSFSWFGDVMYYYLLENLVIFEGYLTNMKNLAEIFCNLKFTWAFSW